MSISLSDVAMRWSLPHSSSDSIHDTLILSPYPNNPILSSTNEHSEATDTRRKVVSSTSSRSLMRERASRWSSPRVIQPSSRDLMRSGSSAESDSSAIPWSISRHWWIRRIRNKSLTRLGHCEGAIADEAIHPYCYFPYTKKYAFEDRRRILCCCIVHCLFVEERDKLLALGRATPWPLW